MNLIRTLQRYFPNLSRWKRKIPSFTTGKDRIAVLIDADNVHPRHAGFILQKVGAFGTPVSRVYGDWSRSELQQWLETASSLGIDIRMQKSNKRLKNSTDIGITIAAMDLLRSERFQGFAIASSDSDFTQLALRLREDGKAVVGFGDYNAPVALQNACDMFFRFGEKHSIEQMPVPPLSVGHDTELEIVELGNDLGRIIRRAMNKSGKGNGWVNLSEIGEIVRQWYPNFSYRAFGYVSFGDMVRKNTDFELRQVGSTKQVRRQVASEADFSPPNGAESNHPYPSINGSVAPVDEAKQILSKFVNSQWTELGYVGKSIQHRKYGCKSLSELLAKIPEFEVKISSHGGAHVRRRVDAQDDASPTSSVSITPKVESAKDISEVETIVFNAVSKVEPSSVGIDGWIALARVGSMLQIHSPSFKCHSYGYLSLGDLMRNIPALETRHIETTTEIRLRSNSSPLPHVPEPPAITLSQNQVEDNSDSVSDSLQVQKC